MAPKPTTTTTIPDAPNELEQVIGKALAAAGTYQPAKEDPPVFQSGYWTTAGPSSPEGTGYSFEKQFVNAPGVKPLSVATLDFYSLTPDELKRFQELAFQAGYYGPSAERGDIPFGSYDPDTFKLWSQYNERAANMYKVGKKNTIWDLLNDDVAHRPENANKNKSRGPLVTQLPDPREIEEMIRGVAPSVIGRDADPAFIADFQAMYAKIISQFQENKYALEGTEAGGTITAPPSAEALASFRLRIENPEQYEEKRAAGRQQAYTQLLKSAL